MQSLIQSARNMGFTQAQSELLTYQTFKGAVELYNKFDFSCEEWIAKVSSKGGTTEAAFKSFTEEELNDTFQAGVQEALIRARDLSLK